MTFEEVVVRGLAELELAVKAAKKGAVAATSSHKMLDEGAIRNIDNKLAEAEDALQRAALGIQAFRSQRQDTGLEEYFTSPEYRAELTACLDEAEVDYHVLGDVLYVYPVLVRLEAKLTSVRIDKKMDNRLRPKKLAALLRDAQKRPSKFPAGRFLLAIFRVYKALASANLRKSEPWTGRTIFLKDIYEVLSAAPGSDYSEQEFVRDLYLLDFSGDALEVRGHVASLEASSGTRDEKRTLQIITREGQRRLYCTIRFDPLARGQHGIVPEELA